MKNKIFLSSMLIMSVAPAMAEPSNTDTFPSDGYMQEDYTYTNAATSTNMDGVYEGSVNATAEYEDVLYQIAAGQYLPAGAESPIDCNVAGSFCAGVQNGVYYDANNNQGLTSCSTATNGAYTLSDGTGNSADSCYRLCSGNVTIEHATGVTGFDYYGNGTDTCEPTACENGWHVKAAVTAPNLTSLIGVSEAGNGYTANTSTGSENSSQDMSNTIIANDPMAFATDYGTKGIIKGHGRCSTRAGADNTWGGNPFTYNVIDSNFVSSLADETGTGQYCYCQLDSYTPSGGTMQSLSAPWVFYSGSSDAGNCASDCARRCASYLRSDYSYDLAYRAAVFGAIESSPAMCEANVININWSNADAADITANNAGTATYGSDVRTPVKAQTIKGKTFKGWRFSAPTQTTTGN